MKSDYYVSIQSGKVAIICGCESVCKYSDEKIVLKISKGFLTFGGCELSLSSYFGNEIKISGNIREFHLGESEC